MLSAKAKPCRLSLSCKKKYSFLLLDKGAPGGKLNEIGLVDNYLGFNSINGPDLAFKYFEHLLSLGIEVTYANVKKISKKRNLLLSG